MNSTIKFLAVSAMATTSAALILVKTSTQRTQIMESSLFAVPPPGGKNSGWGGSRRVPSKTARESACSVEWEPMTELERRIEDGVNYEHIPHKRKKRKNRGSQQRATFQDSIPTADGVFVGYRFTDEEYGRLKSADPNQPQ